VVQIAAHKYMKIKINLIFIAIVLAGCNKSDDDHIYTLYSSYKNNRLHVATFDYTPVSWDEKKSDQQFKKWAEDDNLLGCKKVANLLELDWKNTVNTNEIKYWCEKGKFRR